MTEYSKRERAELRQLAAEVYEWELGVQLELLDKSFAEWRRGKIPSSELADAIHQFWEARKGAV